MDGTLLSHATITSVRWLLRVANTAAAVLALAVALAAWWLFWRPLPRSSGAVSLPVSAAAQVARDELGVPHIEAAAVDDLLFLQGYVTAQDRLWQMDALRRLAAGELAEVVGPAALQSDLEARRLRLKRIAQTQAAALEPGDRALFAAYARGVNHFIETHQDRLPAEFRLLGYDPRPWTIADSVLVGLQMFRSLTSSWKDEFLKDDLRQKANPVMVEFLFPRRTAAAAQLGSNAWVISGQWTASGKPLLANDTHLEWAFPEPWYLVHLKAPDLNVTGFSLPGLPCVIIGHNEQIAWGITNLEFDVQDLYLEQFNPETGSYQYRGQREQARQEREWVRVKGHASVDSSVWVTRHGPIFLSSGNRQFALRWVAAGMEFKFPFLELNRARNWEQFRSALSRMIGPGANFVYADAAGNIGYQVAGKLPIRKTYDGDLPADGASGEAEWEGFIPFEQLPSVFNPPSGMLVTANHDPFGADFPYRVNGRFAPPYRRRQIEARLSRRRGWKAEEMLPLQTDVYSEFSHFLARQVVKAYDSRPNQDAALVTAVSILRAWNGQMRRAEAAPVLATLIFERLRRAAAERAAPGQGAAYAQQVGPVAMERLLRERPKEWFADYDALLMRVLTEAVEEGRRLSGRNLEAWDYGRYAQLELTHPVFGRIPYVGSFFRIGPVPMDGSATTVKQTTRRLGPAMRFVADLADWDRSLQSIMIGQSGQPFSSHFKDQWKAYYSGQAFPMQFRRVTPVGVLRVEPVPSAATSRSSTE